MSTEISIDVKKEEFELSEVQEEYIRIYHEYFVLKWSWIDLCRYHNCSKMKISKALRWVIENRLEIPPEYLINGAIDSIHERLKLSSALLENEVSRKRFRDNNFIISLIREIREDEEAINKLQCVIRPDDKNEEKLSASQTLSLIKAAIVQQQDIVENKNELKIEEV